MIGDCRRAGGGWWWPDDDEDAVRGRGHFILVTGHLTHVTVPRRTSHASHKYQHNHRAAAASSSAIQQTHNLLCASSLVSRIIYFNLSQFHDFYEFYFPVLPSVLGGEPGTGA